MVSDDDIIAWYDETFNKPSLFFKKRWPVTLDTSLSTGDYVWPVKRAQTSWMLTLQLSMLIAPISISINIGLLRHSYFMQFLPVAEMTMSHSH